MAKTFEYSILNMSQPGGAYFEDAAERLDKMGAQGWELVAIYSGKSFLKREKPDQSLDVYEYSTIDIANDAPAWIHAEELTKTGANGWMVIKSDLSNKQNKYVITYLLMRKCPNNKFPIELHSDYNKAGEYIKEPGLPFGMTDTDMKAIGVGQFEDNPPKGFVGHKVEGPAIEKVETATDYFDYSYFFNKDHVWIKCTERTAHHIAYKFMLQRLWFMFYPNTRSLVTPWIIVKKGAKENAISDLESYGMAAEVIPGQHMTEDKI